MDCPGGASIVRLLSPQSIAVVGASRAPGTIGHEVFRNLLQYGFQGPVYPVNPTAGSVAGVRAYSTVLDVPDAVDLAVIVVPAKHVPEVVDQCARKQVRGLVVISAGFAETGAEGKAQQREIVAMARRNGMRMIGPNCLGVVNTAPHVRMNATFAPVAPVPGHVGFLSQSGGLGIELMARVIPVDNILFASEMLGAVKGIDPRTGHHYDDTKRYVDQLKDLAPGDREKIFEGNARRVYPRLDAQLTKRGQPARKAAAKETP